MKRFIPQKVKDLFSKIIHSNSTVREVSDGLAIGVFIAFLPIMGIQMYVSLVVTRLTKSNSIAAMLACWITNPLTFIPIYLFNLLVGNLVYPKPFEMSRFEHVLFQLQTISGQISWMHPREAWASILRLIEVVADAGVDFIIPLVLGSLIVATFFGFVSHRLMLAYYPAIQKRFSKHPETL